MARVSMREAFRRTKARERAQRETLEEIAGIKSISDLVHAPALAAAVLGKLPPEVDDRLERVQAAIYQQLLHQPLSDAYLMEFDLKLYSAGVADRVLAALDGVDQR